MGFGKEILKIKVKFNRINQMRRIMKWMFGKEEKRKPALVLLVIIIAIVASNFLEKKFITDMSRSISSIYEDRLVPAAGLFQINDLMFTKRLVLEEYLLNPDPQHREEAGRELALCNARIDSLILAYEATYLVAEETRALKDFKHKVRAYNVLEALYLSGGPEKSQVQNYAREIGPVFKELHGELMSLSRIQTAEGRQLLEGSRVISGQFSMISNLQIALVVVTALAIQALLRRSRILVPTKLPDFRLN
jgi:hypothetical protein